MSVLDFPSSPTNGQYYNGYVWNAANETWDSSFAPRPATIPISSPNYVINGALDIWQRGTTGSRPAGSGSGFVSADRFKLGSFGSAPAVTLARSTDVPADAGVQYSAAMSWSSSTGSGDIFITQVIEDGKYLFAGKTVTVSFYAKAASNITVANVFDQDYGPASTSLTTSWQRFSFTLTLPTTFQSSYPSGSSPWNNTELRLFRLTNTSSPANTITFTGVQIEEGAAPTTFRRNAATIQGELAACQRYFERSYNIDVATGSLTNNGNVSFRTTNTVTTTLTIAQSWYFKVSKRATPTVRVYSSYNGNVDRINVNASEFVANGYGIGQNGASMFVGGSIPNNSDITWQWTAEAEL